MTEAASTLGKIRAEEDRFQPPNKMRSRLPAKLRCKSESRRFHRQRAHRIPSVFLTAFHGKADGGLAGPRIQNRNANVVIPCCQIFRNVQRSVVYGITGKP